MVFLSLRTRDDSGLLGNREALACASTLLGSELGTLSSNKGYAGLNTLDLSSRIHMQNFL